MPGPVVGRGCHHASSCRGVAVRQFRDAPDDVLARRQRPAGRDGEADPAEIVAALVPDRNEQRGDPAGGFGHEAGVAPEERLGDRGVGIAGGAAGGEADARPARRGSRPEADQLLVVEERPEGAGAVGLRRARGAAARCARSRCAARRAASASPRSGGSSAGRRWRRRRSRRRRARRSRGAPRSRRRSPPRRRPRRRCRAGSRRSSCACRCRRLWSARRE